MLTDRQKITLLFPFGGPPGWDSLTNCASICEGIPPDSVLTKLSIGLSLRFYTLDLQTFYCFQKKYLSSVSGNMRFINNMYWREITGPNVSKVQECSALAAAQHSRQWERRSRVCVSICRLRHHLHCRHGRTPPAGPTGSLIRDHFLDDIPDLNLLPARLSDSRLPLAKPLRM